jgi:hypothetical protein
VSAAALLAELEAVGIQIIREGDNLRVRGEPGVSLAPYTERLREHKPAILVALGEREATERHCTLMDGNRLTPEKTAVVDLDPTLAWAQVARNPVAATRPPSDWDGVVPAGCGAPLCCKMLGPCGHFAQNGWCWADSSSNREGTSP